MPHVTYCNNLLHLPLFAHWQEAVHLLNVWLEHDKLKITMCLAVYLQGGPKWSDSIHTGSGYCVGADHWVWWEIFSGLVINQMEGVSFVFWDGMHRWGIHPWRKVRTKVIGVAPSFDFTPNLLYYKCCVLQRIALAVGKVPNGGVFAMFGVSERPKTFPVEQWGLYGKALVLL